MISGGEFSAVYVADLERRIAESEAARVAEAAARVEAETRLAQVEEARDRLERMVKQARREKFGATSEKLDPDQRYLPFEDLDVAEGMLDAASEAAEKALGNRKKAGSPRTGTRATCPIILSGSSRSSSPRARSAPVGAARW